METINNFRIHKLTDNQYIHAELAKKFSDNDVCIVKESLKLSATPDTLADIITYAKPGTTITLSAGNYAALDLSGVKAYPDNLTIEGTLTEGVSTVIAGITITDNFDSNRELACAISDRAMPSSLVLRNLTFSGPVCVYNCNITGLAISDCLFKENTYLHIRPNHELVEGTFESVPFYETCTANNISIKSCTFEGTTENNTDVIYLSCVNNTAIHHNIINSTAGSGIKIYGEKDIDKTSSGKIAIVGNTIKNASKLGIELSLFDDANICVLYNTINNSASDIVIKISEFDVTSEFITRVSDIETNTRNGDFIGSYDEPEKRFVKGIDIFKNLTELEQAHIDIERKLEQHKDDTNNPHNIKGIVDKALANHKPTDLQLATKKLIFTLANGEQIEMNVYVSDKPVEPDIPVTPEAYKIMVNGVEYAAEKDMTWHQFIGSTYNTGWVSECCGETLKTFSAISGPMKTRSLAYVGYRVCSCGSGYYLLDSTGNYIKTEDLVDNTNTYVIEAIPCSHAMEVSYTWDADHNSCTATATCTKCQYTFDETAYSNSETDSEDSNQFRHYVDFTSGLFSRQYCNAWHEQNNEITFYIDGNQLSCPAGYTWDDFISSEYNSSFDECDCDTAVQIVDWYDDGEGNDYEIRVNWCSTCNTYDGLLYYSDGNVATLNDEILDNHEYSSSHQHNLVYVSTVAPTCDKDGYEIWTCQADHCYYSEYLNSTPAKHSYVNGICSLCGVKDPGYVCTHNYNSVVTQPTCTEQGYTTYTCSKCGNSYKDSFVEQGHVWDNGTITIEPGCETTGIKTFTCIRDNSHTRTETIPAAGHKDSNNDFECDVCHKGLCTEHVEETVNGYAATCTTDGLTDGIKCYKCGYTIKAQEVIKAKGHNEVVSNAAKEATCLLPGMTEGKHCSVCGEVLVEARPVPALGHNMQETSAEISATCTESGQTAIYTCANGCGKTEGGEEIPKTNHSWKWIESVEPTCTEYGYEVYKCEACGETEDRSNGKAPTDEHSWSRYICTECGKHRYGTCSNCGDPLTEEGICDSLQGPECDGFYSVYCDCGEALINGICPSCGANNLTCDNENCGSSFSASSYSEGDTCPDCGRGTLTSEPESEQELCGNCDSPLTNNICTNKECIACPDYEDPDSEPEYCDWCGQYPCECTLCPSCLYGSLNHAGICNNCDYKGEDSGDDFCDDCGEQLTDGECTNYENCPRYVDYCECGERLDELGNCALGEECPVKKREED